MAGFALLTNLNGSPALVSQAWAGFLDSVRYNKFLNQVSGQIEGSFYIAAKLDAPCSLHQGITLDTRTGSWLLAVGTVVDRVENSSDGCLTKLLQDYLTNGSQVFSRLDGQFAIIAYHALENNLCVVSDPFGLIPVYYGRFGSLFYVTTSALAVAKAIRSKPSDIEVRSFLLYGDTLAGSLWEDVHTLQPATALTINLEKTEEYRYWSFQPDRDITSLSEADSVDCIIDGLGQAIQESFCREGKFWISLTGGLDSRTLAALAQYSNLPFKTYCHGPSDSRDVLLSAAISQQMKWEHEYFTLPEDWGCQRIEWLHRALLQTDGQMSVLKASRTVREQAIKAKQLSVSLWGYGGEVYRGYYWKQEFWRTGITSKVDYERLLDFRVIPASVPMLQNQDHWQSVLREAKKYQLQAVGEQQPNLPNTVKLDLIGQYLERHPGSNTIAGILGQERVLLPYYSKDNITRILSTKHQWRTHSRVFRHVLERINPELASMETADGGPALPMQLTNIHKFVPYWVDTGEKLLWRLGIKYLNKPIRNRRDAGPSGKAYPVGRWLQETVLQLRDQGLLTLEKMQSAYLYDENHLQMILDKAIQGRLVDESILSRILTIEMAFREVGDYF